MAELLKFRGRFNGKFLVYVTFDMDAYRRGEIPGNQPTVLCDGKPTDILLPAYKTWITSVMSEIAKRIDNEIRYSVPITFEPNSETPTGNSEVWVSYPDGNCQRAEEPMD